VVLVTTVNIESRQHEFILVLDHLPEDQDILRVLKVESSQLINVLQQLLLIYRVGRLWSFVQLMKEREETLLEFLTGNQIAQILLDDLLDILMLLKHQIPDCIS